MTRKLKAQSLRLLQNQKVNFTFRAVIKRLVGIPFPLFAIIFIYFLILGTSRHTSFYLVDVLGDVWKSNSASFAKHIDVLLLSIRKGYVVKGRDHQRLEEQQEGN